MAALHSTLESSLGSRFALSVVTLEARDAQPGEDLARRMAIAQCVHATFMSHEAGRCRPSPTPLAADLLAPLLLCPQTNAIPLATSSEGGSSSPPPPLAPKVRSPPNMFSGYTDSVTYSAKAPNMAAGAMRRGPAVPRASPIMTTRSDAMKTPRVAGATAADIMRMREELDRLKRAEMATPRVDGASAEDIRMMRARLCVGRVGWYVCVCVCGGSSLQRRLALRRIAK